MAKSPKTKSKPTSWRCPDCGRKFARARQAHSCQVVPLSAHLAKATPETRAIYEALIKAIRAVGPIQIAPTKTGINLLVRTSLGGMTLHKGYVSLGVVLTRKVEHPRLGSMLQLSPKSFVYRIKVSSPSEVDSELKGWIGEAYAVGEMAGRRT